MSRYYSYKKMTHIQDLFIRNLRFFRTNLGVSQIDFSIMVDVSPNYLNAIENGKNFPSIELLQKISDELHILPYQLFLEQPITPPLDSLRSKTKNILIQEMINLKQKISAECDLLLGKIIKSESIDE